MLCIADQNEIISIYIKILKISFGLLNSYSYNIILHDDVNHFNNKQMKILKLNDQMALRQLQFIKEKPISNKFIRKPSKNHIM